MVDSGPEPAGVSRTVGVVSPNCGRVTCGSSTEASYATQREPVWTVADAYSSAFRLCGLERIGQIQPVREHATLAIGRVVLAGLLAGGLWLSASEHPRALARHLDVNRGTSPIAIAGRGRAIDGDTLVIGGVRVRLEGIDAPEAGQTCGGAEFSSWACGAAAQDALARLLAGQHVSCTGSAYDSYGRLLASCGVAGRELNAEMVRRGLAWAFVRYSQRYAALEAEARSRLVGVWRGRAEPPWDFRAKR